MAKALSLLPGLLGFPGVTPGYRLWSLRDRGIRKRFYAEWREIAERRSGD